MNLTQNELQDGKDSLDKAIKIVSKLAAKSERAMVAACRKDMLDMRDDLAMVSGYLHAALGELYKARSRGGHINGGSVIRAGGT